MIISKLESIAQSFSRSTNEEFSQAVARLVFSIIILIGFYIFHGFDNEQEKIYYARMFLNLFLLYAILHWLHISVYKKESLIRKILGITVDIGGVSLILYFTDVEGSVLFPIYFWIVLGNGIRFGTSYLFFSMFLALVGFRLVLLTSSYWVQFPYLGNGLSLSIIILPLFYFVIMHRLHNTNKRLMEQLKSSTYESLHDSLTSLPNRSFLFVQMEDFTKRENSYFLFFIDLDDFKNINDIYGENTGDNVLKEVVSRIENVLQGIEGFAARLGGDEFAVIAEFKDINDVANLAEQLINEISMPYKECRYRISSSIGITHFNPKNPKEIETLLKEADKAMHQVKSEGKNGFRFYQDLEQF